MHVAQILARVAIICAMATASKSSTRPSASDEPPQKKPKTDQHKRPIATPLASKGDGFIQYNDLKDEIIQAPQRRLERGDPELTVAEFLEKYSGEPRVIPLDQILTSMFNRNGQKLNGCQVKHLMTMFAMTSKNGGEDFSRYRYKIARLHEIEPSHLNSYVKHNNDMAQNDKRIRPCQVAQGRQMYGIISKSHMAMALKALFARCIPWHDEKVHADAQDPTRDGKHALSCENKILEPPANNKDLTFAEEHGIWCEC